MRAAPADACIIVVISRGFGLYLKGTLKYNWLSLAGKHLINISRSDM